MTGQQRHRWTSAEEMKPEGLRNTKLWATAVKSWKHAHLFHSPLLNLVSAETQKVAGHQEQTKGKPNNETSLSDCRLVCLCSSNMAPLSTFLLPLPSNGPPTGYSWEGHDMSVLSTTTAFNTGIDERDIFLGKRRCVVCGESADAMLQYCYVIKDKELETVSWIALWGLCG